VLLWRLRRRSASPRACHSPPLLFVLRLVRVDGTAAASRAVATTGAERASLAPPLVVGAPPPAPSGRQVAARRDARSLGLASHTSSSSSSSPSRDEASPFGLRGGLALLALDEPLEGEGTQTCGGESEQ